MPWVHGDDYMMHKNDELRHLLLLRRLPYSGTKVKMASRLVAHDKKRPFPFKKLPPEIRNEIYKLVASPDAIVSSSSKQPGKGHTEGVHCFRKFEAVMVNSSLFRACKETRIEGLSLFYQYHHFELAVEHGGCFLAIQLWLHNIGRLALVSIRYLSISYITKPSGYYDMRDIDQIHEMLSDKATVTYSSYNYPRRLWMIGSLYEQRNNMKVPTFRVTGADRDITTYRYRIDFSELRGWGRLQYSIVFFPGKSWFGPRAIRHKP
ncbi:MAG: hypothetical protein Q9175_005665 [Cornicularia normoerica]